MKAVVVGNLNCSNLHHFIIFCVHFYIQNMPNKCCVTGCKGNYASTGTKVRVFRFPTDEKMKQAWIKAIPRKDFTPTKNSRVCELHFKSEDIVNEVSAFDKKTGRRISASLKYPRLLTNAVPSLFPNCPQYLSSASFTRECPENRKSRLDEKHLLQAITESIESKKKHDEKNKIDNLEDILNIESLKNSEFWSMINKPGLVILINVIVNKMPKIIYSAIINEELDLSAFVNNNEIRQIKKTKMPVKIHSVQQLEYILESLKNINATSSDYVSEILLSINNSLQDIESHIDESKVNTVKFISEQINLLNSKQQRNTYSVPTLIFSSLMYSISSHAYRFLHHSKNIILPHPVTLRKLCNSLSLNPCFEQLESGFLAYIQKKFLLLQPFEHQVILMMDEIHLKACFNYKGGHIVGMSFDSQHSATSAHVFMVKSILSPFKDVVHILPITTITADILHSVLKKIIIGLEHIGFRIVSVISDNNAINRKVMCAFANPPKLSICYPHPCDKSRPLFFVIDPVHLLKCVRNNWLNQKNEDKCMFFPKFENHQEDKYIQTASLSTLKKMHNLENGLLLKYGYRLTMKSLSPSNLEKQNVKLVLQIFNRNVAEALLELGEKYSIPHYRETSLYIQVFIKWWNIMNVKTPKKGKCTRDVFQEPLVPSHTDIKFEFLNQFLDWLDAWKALQLTSGILTKETHSALNITTHSLLEIAKYCVNELNMDYILPGQFQTDHLEARFGHYRQFAGSNYHISIQQLFESEGKIRLQNSPQLIMKSKNYGNVVVDVLSSIPSEEYSSKPESTLINFPDIDITENDILELSDYLPVLAYIGGYCVHSVLKKIKCLSCKDNLTIDKELELEPNNKLIYNMTRGGLLYPQPCVVNAIVYNYAFIKKITNSDLEVMFLKLENQRHFVTKATVDILITEELWLQLDSCDEGHSYKNILNMIIWRSTNTLLNNYCQNKNNILQISKNYKKRKLDTLIKPK